MTSAADNSGTMMQQQEEFSSSSASSETVLESCDDLWNCRDAASVLEGLQRLHRALLKERVDAYDPSETFLAIQGAALRFLPSSSSHRENSVVIGSSAESSQATKEHSEEDESLHWAITEEGLLAAAALACVCVGPAWFAQRKRLRRFYLARNASDGDQSTLQSSTVHPPEHVMQTPGDWRSYSPITEPATSTLQVESLNDDVNDEAFSDPLIPEVLPAALLRHAESLLKFIPDKHEAEESSKIWDQRRSRIAIAQRHLVLALCFEGSDMGKLDEQRIPGNDEAIIRQWTIPGAHALVGQMILFWLNLAAAASSTTIHLQSKPGSNANMSLQGELLDAGAPPSVDPWYVLAVSRSIADLVSTGWRPIPSTIGPIVTQLLVRIASSGISNLDGLWDEESTPSNKSALPETNSWLTAVSSSAEAISALAAMGSRSLIPHDSESDLVMSACYMHVRARLVKMALLSQENVKPDYVFPFPYAERDQVLNQIDSCFADTWELLVALCTNTSCSAPLQGLLKVMATSSPRSDDSSDQFFPKEHWGTREKLDCLASGTALRVLSAAIWEAPRGVNIPAHLRNHMAKHIATIREIAASIHKILLARVKDNTFETKSTLDLLSFALDTVVALGNFCKQQISGGGELISTVEWDSFLVSLEEAFLPWLEYEPILKTLEDDLSSPASCSQGIKRILKRSNIEAQSLILRVGALLDRFTRENCSPFHSIVVYESQRRLYKFMLRKVIPVIDQTDCELLGLSVSRSWVKFGLFPFRVCDWFDTASEILNELFRVEGDDHFVFSPTVRLAALVALENSSRQLLLRSEGQISEGRLWVSQTPAFTEGLGEASDYHAQITKAMVNTVEMSLKALRTRDKNRIEDHHNLFPQSSASMALHIHLVKLTGTLVLNDAVGRDRKLSLLASLETLAMQTTNYYDASNDATSNKQDFRAERLIRLEAVGELERCIEESFVRAPFGSWIVPVVMDSFCRILKGVHLDEEIKNDSLDSMTITLYVLMVLARIRQSCQEGRMILFDWRGALGDIPDNVKAKLESLRRPRGRSSAFLKASHMQGSSQEGVVHSRISCSSSLAEIVHSLVAHTMATSSARQENIAPEMMALLRCHVILGYHILALLWLSGVSLGNEHVRLLFLSSCCFKNRDSQESLFTTRAFGVFMQSRLPESRTIAYQNLPSTEGPQETQLFFECLLHFLGEDRRADEHVIVCRSLLATLPTLKVLSKGRAFLASVFSSLVDFLNKDLSWESTTLVDAADANEEEITKEDKLIFLGLAQELLARGTAPIATNDVIKFFQVCRSIISTNYTDHPCPIFHLALRCLSTIVEYLPVDRAIMLKEQWPYESPQISDNASRSTETDSSVWKSFLPRFVWDICDQRLLYSDHSKNSFGPSESKNGSTFLDDLAIEIDHLEKFEVERFEETGERMVSNWYDDEGCQLLTVGVGSSKSSFRGCVEVVIRSPSRRTRRIYRLPNRMSLRDPHGASSLWAPQQVVLSADPSSHLILPPKPLLSFKNYELQQNYESLISRFDLLMAPTVSEGDALVDLNNVSADTEIDRDQVNRGVPTKTQERPENLKRWLFHSLGDEESADAVLQGIQGLGCAHFLPKSAPDDSAKLLITKCFTKQLRSGQKTDRSITVLDRTIPSNTHKIGLLYAGPSRIGSSDVDCETELLSNQHCSPAFHKFADGLGNMVLTKNLRFFSGGLDVSAFESDGHFARVWVDEASGESSNLQTSRTIAVYHVPSLMPLGVNNRKRHIGNDIVLIVFQDKSYDGALRAAGEIANPFEETESVVSGHFNFVTIHVTAMPRPISSRVTVRLRQGLPDGLRQALVHFAGTSIVHVDDAPAFVRRLAIQADLVCRSMLDNLAPASNTYERYKMLSHMGRYAIK